MFRKTHNIEMNMLDRNIKERFENTAKEIYRHLVPKEYKQKLEKFIRDEWPDQFSDSNRSGNYDLTGLMLRDWLKLEYIAKKILNNETN